MFFWNKYFFKSFHNLGLNIILENMQIIRSSRLRRHTACSMETTCFIINRACFDYFSKLTLVFKVYVRKSIGFVKQVT